MLTDKSIGSSKWNFPAWKSTDTTRCRVLTTSQPQKTFLFPFSIYCNHLFCFQWHTLDYVEIFSHSIDISSLSCLSTMPSNFSFLSSIEKRLLKFFPILGFDAKWFWVEKVGGQRWWRKKTRQKIDSSNKSEWTWERRWFFFFLFCSSIK